MFQDVNMFGIHSEIIHSFESYVFFIINGCVKDVR